MDCTGFRCLPEGAARLVQVAAVLEPALAPEGGEFTESRGDVQVVHAGQAELGQAGRIDDLRPG